MNQYRCWDYLLGYLTFSSWGTVEGRDQYQYAAWGQQ